MTAPGGWLAAKSRAYWDDAARLEREPIDAGGLTGEQWIIVYRTVSVELNKCAKEVG